MIAETVYIAVCCLLLPFVLWGQELGSRNYPFIFVSALYGIWLIASGSSLPFDSVTIAVLSIALWSTASLLWTKSPQSITELLTTYSYLLLFSAARMVQLEIVLGIVFFIGLVFSSIQIYRSLFTKIHPFFIYGNHVHNAAFLLPSAISGLWLAYLLHSVVIGCLAGLIIIAIIVSKTKGAILAVLVSLGVISGMLGYWWFVLILLLVTASFSLWLYKHRLNGWNLRSSFYERLLITIATLHMIRRKPFVGHGLRMFKRLFPDAMVYLAENSKFVADKLVNKKTKIPRSMIFSNKAHNDILELTAELGVIGLGIFVYLFTLLNYDAFSAGFLTAIGVSGMFFFFLGDVHTAMPFWAVIGAVAGIVGSKGSFLPLKIIAVLAIGTVVMFVFKKFYGVLCYMAAQQNIDQDQRIKLYRQALLYDPDNGDYLTMYAHETFLKQPQESLLASLRGLLNFDGNRLIWALWCNLSSLIFGLKNLDIAQWAANISLRYDPTYVHVHRMNKVLETQRARISETLGKMKAMNEKEEKKKKKLKRGW